MKLERMMEIETNDIQIGDQIHVGRCVPLPEAA